MFFWHLPEVKYQLIRQYSENSSGSRPIRSSCGLNIIWLGSSVTYGAQSGGHYSMTDAIQDNHPGTVCEKYAISATTLVNEKEDSYVGRMKLISKDETPDLFVVQLSTNDATTGKSNGRSYGQHRPC